MKRREALRLLAAAGLLPMAPRNLLSLRGARRLLAVAETPRTLNLHQFATVRSMAEMILPRTETPGATDVGAPEFIDLIVTEWYSAEERESFLKGLADVDNRSQTLFAKDFVQCTASQQSQVLTELGEQMVEAETKREAQRAPRQSQQSFYPMLRNLTLTAYYTSEGGARQELHFEMISGEFHGCVQIATPQTDK